MESAVSRRTSKRWPALLGTAILLIWALPSLGQNLLEQVQVHGLLSQGYMVSTDNNYLTRSTQGSFEFNEAIVNFSAPVSDELRVGLQLFSRDLGSDGNNAVVLDWGYGDYRWRDFLGIRAGRIKSPDALYNKGRDIDLLRTSILLPQSIYYESIRDVTLSYTGVNAYGYFPLAAAGSLDYDAYAGSVNVPDPDAGFWRESFDALARSTIQQLAERGFPARSVELRDRAVVFQYVLGGALIWNAPLTGLRLGANYVIGDLELSTNLHISTGAAELVLPLTVDLRIESNYTLSAEYSLDRLTLAGEYNRRKFTASTAAAPDSSIQWGGSYAMLTYRLNDRVEMGAYYSVFYPDVKNKKGARLTPAYRAWQKDLALSARFDLTANWLCKLEVHEMDGAAQVRDLDNPGGPVRNWRLFLAKISYSF
jgi:hypothetical protein